MLTLHVKVSEHRFTYTRNFNSIKTLSQYIRRNKISEYYISACSEPCLFINNELISLTAAVMKVQGLQKTISEFNKFS